MTSPPLLRVKNSAASKPVVLNPSSDALGRKSIREIDGYRAGREDNQKGLWSDSVNE